MPYLDYNASAPLRRGAKAAMLEAMERLAGNPSSPHKFGRAARKLLEDARQTIAELLAVEPRQLIFTSGATEANHLGLRGGAASVIVSAAEHPSVLSNAEGALAAGVDENGTIAAADLKLLLETAKPPSLVAAMSANNETGAITPNLKEIAELVHDYRGRFHCDMTQSMGKCQLPPMVADTITISAHKFGGPSGIGALVCRDGGVSPQLRGGGQERGMRSGTQNVVAACGFAAALAEATETIIGDGLRQYFETELAKLAADVIIFAEDAERLANTSCFALPGLSGETMVISLDLAGFAVGSGSACSSGRIEPSHVIKAMGYSDEIAAAAVRVSMGEETKKSEIRGLLMAIRNVIIVADEGRKQQGVDKNELWTLP